MRIIIQDSVQHGIRIGNPAPVAGSFNFPIVGEELNSISKPAPAGSIVAPELNSISQPYFTWEYDRSVEIR